MQTNRVQVAGSGMGGKSEYSRCITVSSDLNVIGPVDAMFNKGASTDGGR